MKRYTFTTQKTKDILPNGVVRVYFDEIAGEETNEYIPEGEKKAVKDTYPVWTYRAADIPAGEKVDKAAIVNAIVRSQYSQADVEAIFRHRLAGKKDGEFDEFDAFAEAAKARAVEILGK